MIDFDPYSDAFLDHPHECFERLREEDPVHRSEALGAFFLSRFEDVWAATQSRKLSVTGGITPSQLLLDAPANPLMPSQMDPPRHTEVRAVLSPHFRPKAAARWKGEIREIARATLEEALTAGRLDVARDLGARISCHMACRLLGFPLENAAGLADRVNAFFHRRPGHRGETEKAAQASEDLFEWVNEFVAQLRANPAAATGISADLLRCRIEGDSLRDEELVHAIVNLLIAASDSFPKALAGTVDRLAQEPDQRREVVDDPSLARDAFLETVRIDTPTQFQGLTVLEEVEFRNVRLSPGDRVCFLFPAANRDPREFKDPTRFDLHRNPRRTLAFGHGIHLCLGKQLALIEAEVALQELLAEIPDFNVCHAEAHFARTEYVRGWLSLPIDFEARG
ncbi:MAG: cytochrome P450 [Deltaproteobacteria bacterium]|jgi:cytochrome P450|nr:cytochrome P450 [Deltaproteobacteria bacterium]